MILFLSFRQIRPQVRPQIKLVFLISQFEIASYSCEPEFNAWEEVCKEVLKNSRINFQNRHLLPSSPLISGALNSDEEEGDRANLDPNIDPNIDKDGQMTLNPQK
jgi:hypothetical protein